MIIKLYDESDYEYPFIKIDEDYFNIFKRFLEEYKENEDYNLEGLKVNNHSRLFRVL